MALARYAIFPATMASALGMASMLIERSVSPASVVGICSLAAIAVVATAERLLPFDRDWNRSRGDVVTDALHSLISSYAFREVCKAAALVVLLPLAIRASAAAGGSLWPHAWPLAAQVALAAVVAELGQYWAHRLAHERDFFWRLHAVHHSPERLYWLNAGRDHPLGVLWFYLGEATPLVLLGAGPECLTLFFVLESVHGLFQHSNVDVRLGPLNWIFSAAELHRWHHSAIVGEANHNYGATLIVWDVVFGTRYRPAGRLAPETIGLEGMPAFPRSFLGHMSVPFRWRALARG